MDQIPDVSIKNHTCQLLFPFYHRFENLSEADNLEGWQGWRNRLNESEIKRAEDSTLYFQPFVRKMLFPEWYRPDKGRIDPHSTRHLTRMINGQPFFSDFSLQPLSKDGEPDGDAFCGRILWVDTYFFLDQIGILALAVQLTKESITLHQLADFLWAARMVLPPSIGFHLPRWSLSTPPDGKDVDCLSNLIDGLLEPLIDVQALDGKKGETYTQTPVGEEEGERCYTFTYAQLDSDGADREATDIAGLNKRDIWLFELGTVSPIGGMYKPTADYIFHLLAEHRLAVWDSWSALALRDTVTFKGLIKKVGDSRLARYKGA